MQVTALQVKERLVSNLEGVLSHLFPQGKRVGQEFRIGSVRGEPGKNGGGSLAVQLQGPKRGVWEDFACPGDPEQKGDIIDLWCRAKDTTFKEAFGEMRQFVGLSAAEAFDRKPKPKVPTDGISKLTPEVHQYLAKRGLTDQTLTRYKIRSHSRNSATNIHFVLFPFIDSEGTPVMIKSTGIEHVHGKKDIWTSTPYYTLWGWWLVPDDCREIIITEGEIDAMSLSQISPGIPVLSLPNGVSNMGWIENDWEALQRFERIWLAFDNDAPHPVTKIRPGQMAAKLCSRRLGPTRTYRVPIPGGCKDANEVILSGKPELLNWQAWSEKAYTFDPPTIADVDSYREAVKIRAAKKRHFREVNNFIWPKIPFQFIDGDLTEITGYPHGGKSALLYQTHIHEMSLGKKVFIASFEIEPEAMALAMCHILVGKNPEPEDIDPCMDWLCGKLYFYRLPDEEEVKEANLFADLDYAVQRFGTTRIAIDSLHFLVPKEEWQAQDDLVRKMMRFAKTHEVHIALVCHSMIKKLGEDRIPGQAEVEGSGGITKPADNGITVWRNALKAEAIEKAREKGKQEDIEKAEQLPDAMMTFWKNRDTGILPRVKLWFDTEGKTFRLRKSDPVYAPLKEAMPIDGTEETFSF